MQNALENPLAAAAAAAAVSGGPALAQSANEENLLDFDLDSAAPASAPKSPLEGLVQPSNLDDLMSLSGGMSTSTGQSLHNGHQDLMGGFGSLDLGALSSHPPPLGQQLAATSQVTKSNNEDLLGLF